MSGTSDSLNFAYQALTGDGTIVARLASLQGSSSAQAGVMIRETLNANATNGFAVSQSSYNYFYDRTTTGGSESSIGYVYHAVPYWLKVVRSGNSFSSYASLDGINWTQLGTTQTITMASSVYIGLVVSNQSNSSLATATFDNVSINSSATPAPVITSLSSTTGPVGSQFTISGSGFGASQGSGAMMLNDSAMTVNSWASGQISVTVPSGATSGDVVVSVTPGMNDSNPVEFTVESNPLPLGWVDEDLGSVGLVGSSSYSNGVFTVKGAGSGATSGTSDSFHFVYQTLSGDGTLVARVVSRSAGEAGVMIRETLNANATNGYATFTSYYSYFYDRTSTGGSETSVGYVSSALPYWVKVVRSGSTFSGYASLDGVNWTQMGTNQTITMAQNVYIGLVASSESTSSLGTATFDSVSLSSTASPAPTISSISPVAGVAGSQAVISGSGFGATQGNSTVLMNGSAITVNSWGSTSITVTIPANATTGTVLVSVAPAMNDSNAVFFYVGTQTISSSSWLDLDVGSVGVAGSASYANGVFTVKGSGAGVNGAADNMNFLFLPMSGDGTIVARVVSVQGTTSAQAGVMIRETLSPSAANTFMCSCSNIMYSYDRSTTGGQETNLGSNGSGLPYWVKLVRAGNTFTAYTSTNGLIWTQVSSQTFTMAQNVYAGLGVSNYNNSSLATATFDYVSINSSASPAPVITALSATTGTVGTEVGIEGSGFGSSQGSSLVLLNGLTVTVNNWSASEITITIPSGATTGLLVVSVAPNMNDSNALPFEVTTQPLPLTWQDQDINQAGHTATYSGGQFVMTSGSGTVSGTADTFHFIYQPLAGDGTIVARVAYYQWNYSQVGVMIRETLTPGSKHAFVYFAPSTASFCYRSSTGGSTSTQSTSFSNPSGYYPFWVKLARSGNSFTAYVSADNVYWTQVGTTQTITMATDVYIGMAAASVSSVNFDNVSVSSATTTAPVITGLSTSTASIGSQVVITGSGFGATQNGSAVLLNDNPVPIVTWSNTSITMTVPAGSVSGQLGVSVAPSMNDSNAVYLEVTPLPLPTSWMDQDISSVGVGSATYSSSSGIFNVNGAGAAIGSTADSFHFAYQPLSGDGTFIARLISYKSNTTPQIGVMMRETLDPGARDVFVYFQPNTASLYYRATAGASSSIQSTSFSNPSGYFPYWMKMTRSGNAFSGYVSSDGVTWTQVGTTQTITMAQNIYAGLAVTISSTTALFDNVSLSTSAAPAPIITNVSATTGAVGSQVVITGSHFGSSQGSSAVMLSDAPMTVNSWSDTSITITITPTAITGYLAVLVGPIMNASNPVVFTVTSQPLPSGWLDADIGTVGTAGSATYSNGTFTVKAQGSGIDGGNNSGSLTADGFHFAYTTLSGDGAIVARVSNIQGENPGILAGVMIRQTLDPGSPNAFVWYYGNNATFGYRTTSGASASMQQTHTQFSVSYYPYWVKLARIGGTFRAYVSQDGQNWTQVGTTQTITMPTSVDAGLALCNCTALNAATFDNVSITSGTMPLVTGITPTYGTIGTSVTINGSSFGATQGTSTVSFNGALASSVTSWSDTQIVAVVPSNASSGGVSVVVNGIESNTDVGFTFYHPVISNISPSTGQGGANVVITGTGFGQYYQTGFQVLINGTPATVLGIGYGVLAWSDTSVTVVIQPTTTSGPLVVSLQGINSNAVQFNFEPLTFTGVSPSSGPVGSTVTISGTGFGSPQSTSTLGFYGAPGIGIVSWSDTAIVATVPQGTITGPLNVTVGGVLKFGPSFTVTGTTQVTDSLGNTSSYTSGYVGGTWVMTQGQGSGCSSCTHRGNISYTYDGAGNALTRTDENGNTTTYTYDSNSNMLTATVPVSSGVTATTTYTYNSFGEVLTKTDPLGNVTTNTYDSRGNLLTVTTPAPATGVAASVKQFAYNSLGELTSFADPLNNVTTLTYTTAGLIATITDAQNNVTTYGYDAHGNRTSVTDALNHQTTFTYDSMDRLTKITYPDTTTKQFGYDYRGRRTSETDQNGKVTQYAYDDADRPTSMTDANNNVTTYGYDTENNLTSIQDANNNTTSLTYDAFGRLIKTTFPSGYIETYAYDAVGNRLNKTDRKNQQITYAYDLMNRLTTKTYPDNTTVNYTYDKDSRLTQVTDPTGTYSFTFDNMGRLTGTTTQYTFLARNFTTSYSYDKASHRTAFTDPESGSTTYAYDTLNRLQALTPPTAFTTGNFGFSYDALSRRTQMTRPNGVSSIYAYDNLSRLTGVLHQLSGSTIDGASYTLDNAGNRTAKTDQRTAVTTNYGYDNIYELLSAAQSGTTTESYTYDPAGNRLTSLGVANYTNNTSNELTSTSNSTYTYDYNGNALTKTDSTGTTNYVWDYEDRLTSATLPGSGGTITFTYDPFGRRIKKVTPSTTSILVYDGDNFIEETNGTGAIVARYSHGLNIDEPLAMLRSGATSFYDADGLGTITSLANAAGSLAQTYTFDSFGKQIASSGSLTNPFQYSARESDSETGLYYYRARYYNPNIGRFISTDPIGFKGGNNHYAFVKNNPLLLRDPQGTCPSDPCVPEGGASDSVSAYTIMCKCQGQGDADKTCQCLSVPFSNSVDPGSDFMKSCKGCFKGQESPRAACKCLCTLMGQIEQQCDLKCSPLPKKWPKFPGK